MTPKSEGRIKELKGYVLDLHGLDQEYISNKATKDITEYVDLELDQITGKALNYIKVLINSNPKKPDLSQGESKMHDFEKAIFQEEIKEYVKESKKIENTHKKLYGIMWVHTSSQKRVKVQAV